MEYQIALFLFCLFFMINTSSQSFALSSTVPTIPAIFQFGDSLSDTGNKIIAFPDIPSSRLQVSPPYGMTYFHHPANRISDGRLIVDFIASRFGLPFLNPYLANASDHRNGVNFAVSGATALDLDFYKTANPYTFPLGTQLDWFLQYKQTVPQSYLKESLYIVGEIGGNDYFQMWKAGWRSKDIRKYVGFIVRAIGNHTRSLYAAGGRKFLMINLPVQGCHPIDVPGEETFDELGCVARKRKIGEHHNSLFRAMVDELRQELEDAWFVIGDLHDSLLKVLQNPQAYGFRHRIAACCGIFKNEITVACGDMKIINNANMSAKACKRPSEFVFWNDVHFTEHFYNITAESILSRLEQSISDSC